MELEAVVFDLDGVITHTAALHAAAWKHTFDEFLSGRPDGRAAPFDAHGDYLAFVDGRPRHDGVRRFLESREIVAEDETVDAIAASKNARFNAALDARGVEVFADALSLLDDLRKHDVRVGLVTSSRNGRAVIARAGLADRFDAVIDGEDLARLSLRGKPEPDAFLKCADLLEVSPSHAAVVEDAVSGVTAARRGSFGLIVGVDRAVQRTALAAAGADLVAQGLVGLDTQALDAALRSRRERAAWRVEQVGLDPVREHAMESLFTVANGYLGVRGSPELSLPGSQGDLLVAGIYDAKHADRPYSEHEFLSVGVDSLHAELVSSPFPFRLRVVADGREVHLSGEQVQRFGRVLNMRGAALTTEMRVKHGATVVALRTRRCASMAEPHLLLHECTLTVPAGVVVELDASLADPELATAHPHLSAEPVRTDDGIEAIAYRTRASAYTVCIASRTAVAGVERAGMRWTLRSTGEPIVLRRMVAVYSSRDADHPVRAACEDLAARRWDDFPNAWRRHVARWKSLWRASDIRIGGSHATEQALRFHAYHLHSTAARMPHASIGARALTGRAYEGHVFWDVEVFMLPFYLHTNPPAARNALLYRHRTLGGARSRAAEQGLRGACFAWESTVTGEDVTPRVIRLKTSGREIPIFTGTQQIHVTADVAYGVCRYHDATGDDRFMQEAGCEILFETARFWLDRSSRGDDGRFHIRGVVGPDEYHHSVDDNAYTNWLVRYNLQRAAAAAEWLARAAPTIGKRLVDAAEPDAWATRADELFCPAPDARGVIEQFAGFFELEDYPLPAEERLKAPVHRLFDWDRINRLKLIKQADVLMLPFLFPEWFDDRTVAANYHYYEPLTDHGSSLSPGVHAAIAARIGEHDAARRYWRQSLWLDLSNVMTNSALGVHPACMGATWQALMFGFLGLSFDERGASVAEHALARLPSRWHALATEPLWRGARHPVEVSR